MTRFGFGMLMGDGLKARSLRSSMLTVIEIGGSNVLRLISNLILTRLLFPEAFGLMALVQVFISGLKMFSDTGVRASIMRSDREDEDFLNTAWTMQVLRGIGLWLGTCALALPVATLYDEPMLAQILPVTGLTVLIAGFTTTKVATANRNLIIGRLTAIDLGTQVINIVVMVLLAWWLKSVWALVIGGLIGGIVNTFTPHYVLPGITNKLRWDRSAVRELFSFGQFIFLASAVTFIINQGDKLILGGYASMTDLGIYNVGYLFGAMPLLLSQAVNTKVVFPLYRHRPVSGGARNQAQIFKARRMVIGFTILMSVALAYTGVWLVDTLYDPRYALAGPVIVLMSFGLIPRLVNAGSGAVLLAAGDSRNFFVLNASTAALQTGLMFLMIRHLGIFAVVVAPTIATVLLNPFRIYLVRKHNGWDKWGDAALFTFGILATGLACWLHWGEIVKLMG